MIRALLFDAAGTLIEPAEPVAETYSRYFQECGWDVAAGRVQDSFGRAFSEQADPRYRDHADGDAAEREWWREVVSRTMRASGIDPAADAARSARCFELLFGHYESSRAWRVFPEVVPVFEAARREDLRIAVVSNFDLRLHKILEGHGLEFEFVLTSADARARKPDPSIFRQALGKLGLPAGEVMHAGDSPAADVGGARAIGITPFLLDRPRNDLRDFVAGAVSTRRK